MSNTRISVLIADDHSVVRQGLRAMLDNEKDMHVVAEASTGREAIDQVEEHGPMVVIMDLAMPVLNGFEAMAKIRRSHPETKFVVLTAYCDETYVERCLALGAEGFISKENSFLMLSKAIREVVEGRIFFCPIIESLNCVSKTAKKRKSKSLSPEGGLTARELQVLKLVAGGASNKQAAAELGISIKTVEKHRQQLMDKLDIHDTASLTRYAIAAKVIDNDIIKGDEFD